MEPVYQRLLTYKKGNLGDLSRPRSRAFHGKDIQNFIDIFKSNLNNPALTRKEKIAFFRAIQIINIEFGEQGDKNRFQLGKTFYDFLRTDLLPALEKAKSLKELAALDPILKGCGELVEIYDNERIDDAWKIVLSTGIKKREGFESVKKTAVVKAPVQLLPTTQSDNATIREISREIINLKPTIGDANAYRFSAVRDKYINPEKTESASRSMLAAASRAIASNKLYRDSPEDILKLGQDLLKNKSGVCDHMAAAVIAKIVEHIRKGGEWNGDVELVGSGRHAFILINRPHGELDDLDNWKGAIIIDTWLGAVGVHPEYRDRIPSPQNGVISDPEQVKMFATYFGAEEGSIYTERRFSAAELRALAQKR